MPKGQNRKTRQAPRQDQSHEHHPQDRISRSEERGESSIVYGINPVIEALRAGTRPIEEIILSQGIRDSKIGVIGDLAKKARIPVRYVPSSNPVWNGSAVHQGVIARIAAANYFESDDLIAELKVAIENGDSPLVLVLDGVEDPRNLGALIRTAECAGVTDIFIPERRAAGLTDLVAKSAAGALEYVRIARVVNLNRLIEQLKENGFWIAGTSGSATRDYTDWDWTVPTAVVMGAEGSGLRRLTAENCDQLLSIPHAGHIESLNVSVAAGVVLFEALRQRRAADTSPPSPAPAP
jgi:23S rRNA (guanosine2251-2'-O)-methyltransferase